MGNNRWLEDLFSSQLPKQKTFKIKTFYSCLTNQYNNLKDDSKDELHLNLTGSKAHTHSPTGMNIKG